MNRTAPAAVRMRGNEAFRRKSSPYLKLHRLKLLHNKTKRLAYSSFCLCVCVCLSLSPLLLLSLSLPSFPFLFTTHASLPPHIPHLLCFRPCSTLTSDPGSLRTMLATPSHTYEHYYFRVDCCSIPSGITQHFPLYPIFMEVFASLNRTAGVGSSY